MLKNISREELGNLTVARLVLELYADELRWKELDHGIKDAYRDHGLGFAFQCLKAQAIPRLTGKLEDAKNRYRNDEIWSDKEELLARLGRRGHEGLESRINQAMANELPVEEFISIIASNLDMDNELPVRRELEALLRSKPGDDLHRLKHGAISRIIDTYLPKVKRLEAMDAFKQRALDGSLGARDAGMYAWYNALEFADNIPGMAKNAVIYAVLAAMVAVPVALVPKAMDMTGKYHESERAFLETNDGRIATAYAGVHGEGRGDNISGQLRGADTALDYYTWETPIYCTRSSTDSEGHSTTETYQCGSITNYHHPQPALGRAFLGGAMLITERIDDVSSEERVRIDEFAQAALVLQQSLPTDQEIVVYHDIYDREMGQIGGMISFSDSMYREHYAALKAANPELIKTFEDSYRNMLLGWTGVISSIIIVGASAGFGAVGGLLGLRTGWEHTRDYELEHNIRPNAGRLQKESVESAYDDRQRMKESMFT